MADVITLRNTTDIWKVFHRMKEEGFLTNLTIETDTQNFQCHKIILAAYSGLIKTTLGRNERTTFLSFNGTIAGSVMRILINFMYHGFLSLNKHRFPEVIRACDFLIMPPLKKALTNEALHGIKISNVIGYLKLGNDLILINIQNRSKLIITYNLPLITKQQDYLRLPYEEVKQFLSCVHESDFEKCDMMAAIQQWVDYNETRSTHFETLAQELKLQNSSNRGFTVETVESAFGSNVQQATVKKWFIVGGHEFRALKEDSVNYACWQVIEQLKFLFELPTDNFKLKHSICQTTRGFAITGGEGSNLCMLVDVTSKEVLALSSLRTARHSHGSVCVNNVIFLIGGNTRRVEYLKIGESEWKQAEDIPDLVHRPKVSAIGSGIYALDEDTNQLLRLDMETKKWSRRAPLKLQNGKVLLGATMTSTRDKLLVVGGSNRICAIYSAELNVWEIGQIPLRKHFYGAAVCQQNKLLLLGGYDILHGSDDVEEYDMEQDVWSISEIIMPMSLRFHHCIDVSIDE